MIIRHLCVDCAFIVRHKITTWPVGEGKLVAAGRRLFSDTKWSSSTNKSFQLTDSRVIKSTRLLVLAGEILKTLTGELFCFALYIINDSNLLAYSIHSWETVT